MTLFEECLVALGESAITLSKKDTEKMFENMTTNFPFTSWGKIDWSKVNNVISISSTDKINKHIREKESDVYILWDEASLPSIKAKINTVLSALDDVTAVSFDTWIYCPSEGYVIEFYHENKITIGLK